MRGRTEGGCALGAMWDRATESRSEATIVRAMKGKTTVHNICKVMLLTMPRLNSRWGQCSLLPNGLPLLKSVVEEKLKAAAFAQSAHSMFDPRNLELQTTPPPLPPSIREAAAARTSEDG
eukprot:3897083-Pyramimonas_sp.AAC.1